MAWLGRKKLAFIPLSRTGITPPDQIPPDWPGQIMQRLFYDPATPGADLSVRTYFHTVSSGLADLDAVVLPAQTIAEEDVPPDALAASMEAQLVAEGYVGAAIVMLGGPGGGTTTQPASFSWSRFCMSDNLGNWAGELLHQVALCGIPDFFDFAGNYPQDENMGPYEQEAGYDATHPCAWTKRAVGWLDPSAVAQHPGGTVDYLLHAASLPQPPPTDRAAAVQIGSEVPYLMVEGRVRADAYDVNIPAEGVIVYWVQTTDPLGHAQNNTAPLALVTKTALGTGQSVTIGGYTITNTAPLLGGGFAVQVAGAVGPGPFVPDVVGLSATAAEKILTDAGYLSKFVTPGHGRPGPTWVASQSPPGGSSAPHGTVVTMVLRSGPEP
ncbi:MAG: PASTA domain-containing protein [Caulobacteraceae bacterium]|nr:PASTA domain-containing protein [Caulobacteraceae bacterium]